MGTQLQILSLALALTACGCTGGQDLGTPGDSIDATAGKADDGLQIARWQSFDRSGTATLVGYRADGTVVGQLVVSSRADGSIRVETQVDASGAVELARGGELLADERARDARSMAFAKAAAADLRPYLPGGEHTSTACPGKLTLGLLAVGAATLAVLYAPGAAALLLAGVGDLAAAGALVAVLVDCAAGDPEPVAPTMPGESTSHLLARAGCTACHATTKWIIGPAFHDIAVRYQGDAGAPMTLFSRVKLGTVGHWGQIPMPPNVQVADADLTTLVTWTLQQ